MDSIFRRTPATNMKAEWREDCRGVENRLQNVLLGQSFLWDVGFQVGTNVFKAHKLILAVGSPVFEQMFYSMESETTSMIIISEVDPVGFRNLMLFLYSGNVSFRLISEALSTYEVGDKYEVPELKELSEKYLVEQDYRLSSVWPVLENAEELNMATTKKKCLEFVGRNTQAVLKSGGLLSASFQVIQTILGLNEVSVPEVELLDFLALWVKRRTGRNSKTAQPLFNTLVPYIRFKAIKPNELSSFLNRHPECLDDHDSTQILKHLVKPDSTPLPEWCNHQPPRKNALNQPQKTFVQKLWSTLKDPQLF